MPPNYTRYAESVRLTDPVLNDGSAIGTAANPLPSAMFILNTTTLMWEPWGGGGGGGGGGGDASAANQLTEINRLEAIRDRLPAALVAGRLSVDIGGSVGLSADVTDRDARLLGRTKVLNTGGAAIDLVTAAQVAALVAGRHPVDVQASIALAITAAQLPAALVGGRLDVNVGAVAATIKAREDTAAMTWVSLKSAAPALNTVQADTGALAAGDYDFDVLLAASDTVAVGKGLILEHRNAANGATLQTLGGIPAPGQQWFQIRRYTMALNERMRVLTGTAAGAAASMYVSAIGRRAS